MEEPPFAMATSRLVADLVRDTRRLIAAEIDLARAELSENGEHISSGLVALVGGAAFLLAGLVVLMAAASLFLVRLGTPMDVAFLVVALTAIVTGWLLVRSAMHALRPHRLVPARTLSQISSVLGRR